jgi:hypothetical protein
MADADQEAHVLVVSTATRIFMCHPQAAGAAELWLGR